MIEVRESDLYVYSRHGKNGTMGLCDVEYIFAVSNVELDEFKIITAEKHAARARIHYANHKSPLLACRTLPRIVICCAE